MNSKHGSHVQPLSSFDKHGANKVTRVWTIYSNRPIVQVTQFEQMIAPFFLKHNEHGG